MIKAPTPYLVSPFSATQRSVLFGLAAFWLATVFFFYNWWFDPAHVVTPARFWTVTLALFWITILPAYFLFFILRARVPNPELAIPDGWRVAMVVTKAPSEPFSLVKKTIEGMLRQRYPHDTWLADEDPDPETVAWCSRHGVRISTRKNIAEYHQPDWPRRTRCKEGNLAYFYDKFGYDHYDFVIQMDADHIPQKGYLEEMLRPFVDPGVGYVSAPSICDMNAGESWAARARLYAEAHMHGLQQNGHTNRFSPLCIGSHYAVRTKALKQIGGLGPELAEDHSTTLLMNSAGWRGVHAIHAIARGFGPQNFSDFAIQEFQWARSLTTILLEYTPQYWHGLSWRQKFQFAFCQLWYPLFPCSMFVFLLLPAFALYTSTPWVTVIYLDFLWRASLMVLPVLLFISYLTRLKFARPRSAKVISWESILFLFIRWPWSLLGCIIAVWDHFKGRRATFKITPKPGVPGTDPAIPLRFSLPYLAFSLFALAPVFVMELAPGISGYIIFSLLNALIYALVFSMIVFPATATDPDEDLDPLIEEKA